MQLFKILLQILKAAANTLLLFAYISPLLFAQVQAHSNELSKQNSTVKIYETDGLDTPLTGIDASIICDKATLGDGRWTSDSDLADFVVEAKRRSLNCEQPDSEDYFKENVEPLFVDASNIVKLNLNRGKITDRRGEPLALNIPVTALFIDPKLVSNVNATANILAEQLENFDPDSLSALIRSSDAPIKISKRLTSHQILAIRKLELSGVSFEHSSIRAYPRGEFASHIIGHVGEWDYKGLSGVEEFMDQELSAGDDVTLTLDADIQDIIEKEIAQQIDFFEAIGGAGIMLDLQSGEILSAVSLPNFNPNQLISGDNMQLNRVTGQAHDIGSVFKVLNTAIALETKAVNLGQIFDVSEPYRIGRFTINDFHFSDEQFNISKILLYSSNIGSAKIADLIGVRARKEFMYRLGLLKPLDLPVSENAAPVLPQKWDRLTNINMSYGHGLGVSLTHVAAAIAAAAGDGIWRTPTLLRGATNGGIKQQKKRVFSKQTTKEVRSMMRLNVSHPDGTGSFADAKGYMVAGKTGTAEKFTQGQFDKSTNIASFVSVFPAHDPKYLLAVLIDEPKGQKQSYGYATGGWVAAPVVRRIVERVAPLLGVLPVNQNSREIKDKLVSGLLTMVETDLASDESALQEISIKNKFPKIPSQNGYEENISKIQDLYSNGEANHYGIGTPVNYEIAFGFYAQIIDLADYPPALNNLGVMHKYGRGTPTDFWKAADLFHRALAVEPRLATANYELAEMFHRGLGVDVDPDRAVILYRAAAANGHSLAALKLADMFEYGMGVDKDQSKATFWLQEAANPTTQLNSAEGLKNATMIAQKLLAKRPGVKKDAFHRGLGRYVALMIGAEEYEDFDNLNTPIRDVEEIGLILNEKYGFEVKSLFNPSRGKITKVLNELVRELEPDDTLFIYFAGHGKEVSGDGYWLPVDAEKDYDTYWISNDYITQKLKNIKATNVLVVADSCYSGTLSRGVSVDIRQSDEHHNDALELFRKTKSRVVITSGNIEPVLDGGGGHHSVFARAFISSLVANNDPISATELYNRARTVVIEDTLNLGDVQTPTLASLNQAGHIGPDFVFIPR